MKNPYCLTDGYNFSYSDDWRKKYATEIETIKNIEKERAERAEEMREKERLEKERQEQEQKERDVENRGYDGL